MTTVTSEEKLDIHILRKGKTARDFMDSKIRELNETDNKDPFHVANLDVLSEKHLSWLTNLPRVRPFFAMKCNNTPAVVSTLSALGTGFDCASQAEIQLALDLGVAPNNIIYAHPCKPESHIKYACTHGVEMMTFDSQEELSKIARCHPRAKLVIRIAVDDSKALLRLSEKYGAKLTTVHGTLKRARELGLEVIGVSFHVGSGCTDTLAYRQAIANAHSVFNTGTGLGFQMSLLDIGGGFPGRKSFPVKFEEIAAEINLALDEFFPHDAVQIIAEPGRYYMEAAFTLAVNVIAKKVSTKEPTSHNNDKDDSLDREMMYYVNDGVHGSMSFLINDPVQGKVSPSLHRTVEKDEQIYPSVIWGPTCDSRDKIAENCDLPELQPGDWLLIDNMGAYTTCLSTNFNGFKRADVHCVMTHETWKSLRQAYCRLNTL